MQGLTKRQAKAYFEFVEDCHIYEAVETAITNFKVSCDIESTHEAEELIHKIESFLVRNDHHKRIAEKAG